MSRPAALPRLSGPGELVAALPVLCGFAPAESLVVVCLQGAGPRVGLTVRLDLPEPAQELLVVQEVGTRLRAAGMRRAYALVVTEDPGEEPRPGLMAALQALRGVDLLDLLLVRDERWRSYLCRVPSCCPVDGTPVPAASPGLTLVRAQAALEGRAALPSREALVAALAPPDDTVPYLLALRETELRLAAEVLEDGRGRVRRRLLRSFRAGLRSGTADGDLRPAEADAELALALTDVLLRDEVLTWSVAEGEQLLTLLLALAARTPAPYDAPVCACLAWVAYSRGDGASASIALDRALETDPEHSLALLLRSAVDRQVPPRELQAVAVRTAVVLGRRP